MHLFRREDEEDFDEDDMLAVLGIQEVMVGIADDESITDSSSESGSDNNFRVIGPPGFDSDSDDDPEYNPAMDSDRHGEPFGFPSSPLETNNATSTAGNDAEVPEKNDTKEASSEKEEEEEEEKEEEDELLKAFAEARKVNHVSPPDIRFKSNVTDVSFHPCDDLVAISSVTGDAFIYRYSVEQCELVSTLELHSRSCDGIEYSHDGDWIATFGRDNGIMISDSDTGALKMFYEEAHECPIASLAIINENTFCSGDEEGTVCVWDTRKKTKIHSYKVGNDQINCLLSKDKIIVSGCGETLHAYCTSRKKSWQSDLDYPDADLTSMCLMKQEKKLVVGTVKGDMLVFNWGEFGLNCDQLSNGKTPISALLPVTEDILLIAEDTGRSPKSTSACISACSIYPHQLLGVVGQHDVSVDRLDISHDGSWAGSVGCDETMRFWNIGYFEDIKVAPTKTRAEQRRHNLPSSRVRNPGEFFAGLE